MLLGYPLSFNGIVEKPPAQEVKSMFDFSLVSCVEICYLVSKQ